MKMASLPVWGPFPTNVEESVVGAAAHSMGVPFFAELLSAPHVTVFVPSPVKSMPFG